MTKQRLRRIDYKMKGKAIPMFRFGKPDMNKVVVTEEDKALRLKLMKAETHLDRILGKLKMGLEVTPLEKKRVPLLKARIKHLKSKLFTAEKARLDRESKSSKDDNPEKE